MRQMTHQSYTQRRGEIAHYFDRTAVQAWERLTSDAPVSKIRETVRKGRQEMQRQLLDWLPEDLKGMRVLDAGCGTGLMATELYRRGADVVAIDLSPTLVNLAQQRFQESDAMRSVQHNGSVDFRSGDMLDEKLGDFDHVVAMDSLIHYGSADMVEALGQLCARTSKSILMTHAPSSLMLRVMHRTGKLFPRSDRSPSIVPVSRKSLEIRAGKSASLGQFEFSRHALVSSGFYKSEAQELTRMKGRAKGTRDAGN